MQKWNMIIDVAECTNCNLCTLAVMDEYAVSYTHLTLPTTPYV